MNNLVIGGGISGLIFCYYNPEFILITDTIGGLLNNEETFGNMVLWDTPETRQLLQDLGLPVIPVKEEIHYYFNEKIYMEAPEILRKEYLRKRMGSLSKEIDFTDLALSTEETNFIAGLKVEFWKVVELLKASVNLKKFGEVISIRDNELDIICSGEKTKETISFSKLVSTIPAPAFWTIWNGRDCDEVCSPEEFKSTPTTYISFCQLQGILKRLLIDTGYLFEDFRYSVYFLDNSPFHRLTRTSTGKYSVHFTGEMDIETSKKILELEGDLKYRVEKIGQFLNHHGNFPPKNIMFLGRHAQWSYKVKIQDIVRVARFSKFMLSDMRSRQSRFNKNFMPFSNMTFSDRQRLTEKWILYIQSELAELLKETNWKLHRPMKDISRAKILEEYIDILKFTLGLADVWGFSDTEIFEAFHRKSSFVEERYRKEVTRNE